ERLPREDVARAVQHLYMSWDDLRAWLGLGMEVGGHTVTHPVLARLSPEHALAEIRASKATLEREAGREVTLFAYPNGKAGDFSDTTARLLAEAGFVAACTTIEELNDRTADPLALRRICVRDEPLPLFALRLAGILPRVQAALRRSRS
ncbi:MAG TPA: polysaccharide deacetylase family protein, partial [Thermomicrobiales bacterium]|nr:polysaccharide deacetylase family protein [Thermomicrobiales bacterium]